MGRDKNKPIVELDKSDGKVIHYWPSAKAAGLFYGMNTVGICYNVTGKTKQAKGHYFRFATKEEIKNYTEIQERVEAIDSKPAAPVEQPIDIPNIPAETIPEVIEKPDNQDDEQSPFYRLLQKSKKKFNKNSE